MRHFVTTLTFLFLSQTALANLSYNDVQLCTNAYNHLWWTFETVKSEHRGDPATQATILTTEFNRILDPDFHFGVINLPIPPNFDTTINLDINGITDLVTTAAYGINNWGEHHVATPFSVKLVSSSIIHQQRVYSMTTRDIDYTRDPNEEGGCTIYLSQKDVICTVKNDFQAEGGRRPILNEIIDNVVTAYTLPAPQCGLWIAPPVTDYVP